MISKLKWHISNKNRCAKYLLAKKYIKIEDRILDIGIDPTLSTNTNYFEKMYNLKNELTCLGVYGDFSDF